MFDKVIFIIINLSIFVYSPAFAAAVVGGTGLPIPRFVSLKSDEANIRTGPGTRYPILWVYRRTGMPVEIIEEFDMWRKIRDAEGTVGWLHATMLDGKRNAIVKGKKPQIIRIDHDTGSKGLLKVEPTVIVRIAECSKDWCKIQISGRKGWIEKTYLWGVYPDELIE